MQIKIDGLPCLHIAAPVRTQSGYGPRGLPHAGTLAYSCLHTSLPAGPPHTHLVVNLAHWAFVVLWWPFCPMICAGPAAAHHCPTASAHTGPALHATSAPRMPNRELTLLVRAILHASLQHVPGAAHLGAGIGQRLIKRLKLAAVQRCCVHD